MGGLGVLGRFLGLSEEVLLVPQWVLGILIRGQKSTWRLKVFFRKFKCSLRYQMRFSSSFWTFLVILENGVFEDVLGISNVGVFLQDR